MATLGQDFLLVSVFFCPYALAEGRKEGLEVDPTPRLSGHRAATTTSEVGEWTAFR